MGKGSYITQTPLIIPGANTWLNSNVLTSGNIATWTDSSGIKNNATQITGSFQPSVATINGRNAASFDGIDNFLNVSANVIPNLTSGSFTLFLVGVSRVTSPGVTTNFLGTTSAQRTYIFQRSSDNLVVAAFGGGTAINLISGVLATSPFIAMISVDGSTDLCTLKVNNGIAVTGTKAYTGAPSGVVLGAYNGGLANFLNGLIGEVIVYRRILTASEELMQWRYLSNGWGIAI